MFPETKKSKKHKKNKRQKEHEDVKDSEKSEDQVGVEEHTFEQEEQSVIGGQREFVDDSDAEDQPKRKKKKKKPIAEVKEEGKKGKKSIRQMKREKHAQRQAEAQAASKNELKSQCLSYLSQWKYDKQNWKFMKAKQVWLYKNKFSSQLIQDASWPLLLEYFESAQGNIRNLLLEDANKVIQKMDEWIEGQNGQESKDDETEESETTADSTKPDEISYKRARDLIQCLQE